MTVRLLLSTLWIAGFAPRGAAQDRGAPLGDLARKERARKAAVAQPAKVITTVDGSIDCGANWTCLMQAVDDRIPARLSVPETIDLAAVYGWVIRSTVRLDLGDCSEEKCMLRGRTENTTLALSDAARRGYLDRGYTPVQVDGVEKSAEARAQRQDVARVTCTFQRDKLKEFLARRRDGSEDDGDWRLAGHCQGLDQTITNPNAPPPKPLDF